MPDLALYQPDIPGNTGTLIRLAACTATVLHVIGPAGFRMDDAALKRSGMDYLELASVIRHVDWQAFLAWRLRGNRRLVLMTTKASEPLWDFRFKPEDILLLGRESSGVPESVHAACDARITIPMAPEARSLNLAVAGAMALGEALGQMHRMHQTGHPC
ncbi:MAG: tRNA (cytidine(34)-2'-O)-methyltransferase [Nitratireductor sp.]